MNFTTCRHSSSGVHARSRGVASLAITLIMLALSALVVLYANRGQLFEQRTAANQMRATAAFEAAEAGIEWALARLNDQTLILPSPTSNCLYSSAVGAASFKSFYTPWTPDPTNPTLFDFTPPLGTARAACAIDDATGALACHCPLPGAGGNVVIASPGRRSFVVEYLNVVADPGMVEIRSVGCRDAVNAAGAPVVCGAAGSTNDGESTITVRAKYVPTASMIADSALTTGSYAAVCGAYDITNTCVGAGGVLVNSGNAINIGNGTYTSGPLPAGAPNCGGGGGQTLSTIPGTPITAVVIPNDTALAAASATSDSMMFAYFGMTIEQYKASPTCVINGTSASDRANNVLAANSRTTNPCSRFWVNGDLQFSGNATLGSAARPIMLASAHDMTFNGNYDIFGVIYGDNVNWNHNGTGSASVTGQIVVRGSYYSNGNGSINYDCTVLQSLLEGPGEFIRVPGSWRDFQ